jgi:ribA/ribD-fused uncharacterized protein
MGKITQFTNDHGFLSNFYYAPFSFAGYVWPTVEHAFQAYKTTNLVEKEEIRRAETPGAAKKLGRKVTLREDWEEVKDDVMWLCLLAKFSQNEDLASRLKQTEDAELVEGNSWHDNYWGDCSCNACSPIKGDNKLGQLLMEVRDELP